MSNVSGKGRVKMLWRAGLRNVEPGIANVINNRVKVQEVMLECGNDELKQN